MVEPNSANIEWFYVYIQHRLFHGSGGEIALCLVS